MRACARHLKDLRRAHSARRRTFRSANAARPKFVPPIIEQSYCTSPAALCVELARSRECGRSSRARRSWRSLAELGSSELTRTRRGTRGAPQMSSPRKTAKRARRSPQELLDAVQERLDATPERLARARESRADADPRRRPHPPHSRSVRHHARQPAARAARSQAQRHPLAGRRIVAPHPSAREARPVARGRARPGRLDRLRPPPGPAAVRHRAPRPRQAARGRGPGRPARLADRDPHRHRGRGRARLPRLRPRTRHPLARRRRGLRPAAGRARHDRRAHGGHAKRETAETDARPIPERRTFNRNAAP